MKKSFTAVQQASMCADQHTWLFDFLLAYNSKIGCAVWLYLVAHEFSASAMLSIQLLGYKGVHLLTV